MSKIDILRQAVAPLVPRGMAAKVCAAASHVQQQKRLSGYERQEAVRLQATSLPALMPLKVFAQQLRCNVKTIRRWIESGKPVPRPVWVGERMFFVQAECEAYVQRLIEQRERP